MTPDLQSELHNDPGSFQHEAAILTVMYDVWGILFVVRIGHEHMERQSENEQ